MFLGSIGVQLAAVAALCVGVYMWPHFPNEIMKHYAKYHHYVDSKAAGTNKSSTTPSTTETTGQSYNQTNYTAAKTNNNTKNYANAAKDAPVVDWDKLTEKHAAYYVNAKEEHKEITA